jgi:hypothetical protein
LAGVLFFLKDFFSSCHEYSFSQSGEIIIIAIAHCSKIKQIHPPPVQLIHFCFPFHFRILPDTNETAFTHHIKIGEDAFVAHRKLEQPPGGGTA